MKIGIIGTGKIGSTLARLWAKAGHEVILSCRHPEQLRPLAQELGKRTLVGAAEDAARLGEAVVVSIPLREIPKLSDAVRESLRGKVVIDTCNPFKDRDGEAAEEVFRDGAGTGVWTAKHLPGARIVRAFNSVRFDILRSEAHRSGEPLGIPLASNDPEAMRIVAQLVRDAGFGPVIVGELERGKEFDPGTPAFVSGASTSELEQMLGAKGAA